MDISKFTKDVFYAHKDIKKFKHCSKLISRGVVGSSSDMYSKHELSNTHEYTYTDIVGISSNGGRRLRQLPDFTEILIAIDANVRSFIIDKKVDRERTYNVGEREVASFLIENGYIETNNSGIFIKMFT